MQYHVTAVSNDKAEIIMETLQTTCPLAADFIADHWEDLGYKVLRRVEG